MTAKPSAGPSRTATAAAVIAAWGALGLLSSLDSYLLSLAEGVPRGFGATLVLQTPPWLLWALLTPVVLQLEYATDLVLHQRSELGTDFHTRIEGTRIKHYMKRPP